MRSTKDDGKLQFRKGTSLMEVLIAMFVLSIGMMGLLALFPLAAVQMATAVKDERTSQLAEIMEGHFRIMWRSWMTGPTGLLATDQQMFTNEPALMALDNPAAPTSFNVSFLSDATYLSSLSSGNAGQPLLIDQIGWDLQPANSQQWVAGGNNVFPRRGIQFVNASPPNSTLGAAARLRLFCLLDDQFFGQNGLAQAPVQRQYRYNAALLLQRDAGSDRHNVHMQVVVYSGRPPGDFASTELQIPMIGTVSPTATQTTSPDTVTLNMSGISFPKNSWICLVNPITSVSAFADFYRVVGVAGNTVSISPSIRDRNNGNPYSANVLYLSGVSEVFDRGTISPTDQWDATP